MLSFSFSFRSNSMLIKLQVTGRICFVSTNIVLIQLFRLLVEQLSIHFK